MPGAHLQLVNGIAEMIVFITRVNIGILFPEQGQAAVFFNFIYKITLSRRLLYGVKSTLLFCDINAFTGL